MVGALLLIGVLWLWMLFGGETVTSNEMTESSRRVLDGKWRALPEGEMTIGEMESYAAGLSDEELWQELEKSFEDWLEKNGGEEDFEQPRLAISLARELGKRDRELGLREVVGELQKWEETMSKWGEFSLDEQIQFVEMRIRLACFAGWVSVDPDEAISRLVESRRNEEERWPVVNQGFLMYIKFPEFFAMEEVLRDGFGELARSDFARAKELLEAGTGVWAFDPNEVVGSLLAEIPREDWAGFFDRVKEEVDRKYGGKNENGDPDSFATRFCKRDWTTGYLEIFSQEEKSGWSRNDTLWAMARDRPDEVILALKDDRIGGEKKRWLFVALVAADSKHLHLLDELADPKKVDAVHVVTSIGEIDFRLLTGKEGFAAKDFDSLTSVVEKTPMGKETRQKIDGILKSRAQSWR